MILLTYCTTKNNHQESSQRENSNKAWDIVHASIQAHGGLEKYQQIQILEYTKTIILFDSLGNEESRTIQKHRYDSGLKIARISWKSGDDSIEVRLENGHYTRYLNGQIQSDENASGSAESTINAAFFVLFLPFKLLDQNVSLKYHGTDSLRNGVIAHNIEPSFDEGDDRWWFYIDVESNLLIANKVSHKGRYSMIENLSFDTTSELTFNHHRKSYFVDSLNRVRYLRAEYFYEDFIITP